MEIKNCIIDRKYWPTEGWKKSRPEEQCVDPAMLEKAAKYITGRYPNNRSFAVIKNGYLIYERINEKPHDDAASKAIKSTLKFALKALGKKYATFEDRHDGLDNLRSATKSIVSALVGIAIDKGYIPGTEEKAAGLVPEKYRRYFDGGKEEITIGHLLRMKSGLASIDKKGSSIKMLFGSGDWAEYFLKQPISFKAGTEFDYNSANPHLLSLILAETTNMSCLEFAKEYLFGPLGIKNVYWEEDEMGVSFGGGNLFMRPDDLAKIGFLYLNGGKWDGQAILSGDWIAETLISRHEWMYGFHYGYLWYTREEKAEDGGQTYIAYSASGAGGQLLFVIPELDVIAVTTSTAGMAGDRSYIINDILGKFIIPAINQD